MDKEGERGVSEKIAENQAWGKVSLHDGTVRGVFDYTTAVA